MVAMETPCSLTDFISAQTNWKVFTPTLTVNFVIMIVSSISEITLANTTADMSQFCFCTCFNFLFHFGCLPWLINASWNKGENVVNVRELTSLGTMAQSLNLEYGCLGQNADKVPGLIKVHEFLDKFIQWWLMELSALVYIIYTYITINKCFFTLILYSLINNYPEMCLMWISLLLPKTKKGHSHQDIMLKMLKEQITGCDAVFLWTTAVPLLSGSHCSFMHISVCALGELKAYLRRAVKT